MLKTRLIPVLLLRNGLLVRAERFNYYQIIGNPINEVQRYNEWNVDELIYLDITRDGDYDQRRHDVKNTGLLTPLQTLETVSKNCFMPLTWGGRIQTIKDMQERFERGADKIVINSAAVRNNRLIEQGANAFGSQAIVVSIDAKPVAEDRYEVYIDCGQTPTGLAPDEWAKQAESLGAGEILINNVDRDGTGTGFDVALIERIASVTNIPVIACGGVGQFKHYADGIRAGASAVAAANLWHFKEHADTLGKQALAKAGVDVRLRKTKR